MIRPCNFSKIQKLKIGRKFSLEFIYFIIEQIYANDFTFILIFTFNFLYDGSNQVHHSSHPSLPSTADERHVQTPDDTTESYRTSIETKYLKYHATEYLVNVNQPIAPQ